jgi:hypothetical protein
VPRRKPVALGQPQLRNPVRIAGVSIVRMVDETPDVPAAGDATDGDGSVLVHLAGVPGKE